MLTTDLLRVRTVQGEIRPAYLDADDPELLGLARQLIEIFTAHRGQSRGDLDRELTDLLGTGTAFLLHRGLAKLLFDRSTFEAEAPVDPPELRRAVFEAAAEAWRAPVPDGEAFSFSRGATLARAAATLELPAAGLEAGLHADLKREQILGNFEEVSPEWLLRRYNVALAQAVLLRATELTIELGPQPPRDAEALFRRIKFFQLLHRIRPRQEEGEGGAGGWEIHLDGPLSLFQSSQKYGLLMAIFLPTLLHLDRWQLTATLAWGKKRLPRTFRLSSEAGLAPYGQLPGRWLPEELERFPDDFHRLDSGWEISTEAELMVLGEQGVLVPDFSFFHPPTGTRAAIEVLGFWNKGAVSSRLALLSHRGPRNLILAVSRGLAARREDLDELPAEVYVFRSFPLARQVVRLLGKFLPGA